MLNLRPKAARDDEPDLTPLIDMVLGSSQKTENKAR